MNTGYQKRSVESPITRADADDSGPGVVRGYAVVFSQTSEIADGFGGSYFERFDPNAFDHLIDSGDIRALFDHDSGKLLGRQTAGTLSLSLDKDGMGYEIDLPDTTTGRDVAHLVDRGDLRGASFGFIPGDVKQYEDEDGNLVIVHTRVEALLEISVVTWPAFDQTTAAMRSINLQGLTEKILSPDESGQRSTLAQRRAAVAGLRHRARYTGKGKG